MMPFIPFASQDVEGDVVTTSETLIIEYHGESDNVSILGEWDWNTETELVEVNGVWTAELELSEGLYCYKFIVDGTIFLTHPIPNAVIVMESKIHYYASRTTNVPNLLLNFSIIPFSSISFQGLEADCQMESLRKLPVQIGIRHCYSGHLISRIFQMENIRFI